MCTYNGVLFNSHEPSRLERMNPNDVHIFEAVLTVCHILLVIKDLKCVNILSQPPGRDVPYVPLAFMALY